MTFSLKAEKARFGVLAFSHMLADFFSALLPGILPAALLYFRLELKEGVLLLCVIGIVSNVFQIPAAFLAERFAPWKVLTGGLILTPGLLCLPFLPETTAFGILLAFTALSGCGIAAVHPAGLNALHALRKLPAETTIPIFMTCGFFGAAVAPWAAASLVHFAGLKGLTVLVLLPGAAVALLAVNRPDAPGKDEKSGSGTKVHSVWSFGALFLIATLINGGTAIVTGLLPTMLHGAGHALWFGGFSNMLFGAGSAVGSITLGLWMRRIAPEKMILPALAAGIPLGALYLGLAPFSRAACPLVFATGLLTSSGYPLLVALSGTARGAFSPSMRNGLIVGGTWGIAGALLFPAGRIAARFGVPAAVATGMGLYFFALAAAFFLREKKTA